MLVCSRIFRNNLATITQKFSSSKKSFTGGSYEVLDIKNSHLVYIKDPKSSLAYMSQITTQNGEKGIVIKLQQQQKAVIGMYNNMDSTSKMNIVGQVQNKITSQFQSKFNNVYDIALQSIAEIKDVEPNRKFQNRVEVQGKRKRIQTISPVMTVCSDIYLGNFVNFVGPLGSGRTTNALQIMESFTNSNLRDPVAVYLNTNAHDFVQTSSKASQKYRTISFSRKLTSPGQSAKKNNLSSVGVVMLALKCIQVAQSLKKKGNNVILVVDNINQILSNQWTVLQNLNLSISPFNILNKLHTISSQGALTASTQPQGSLTTLTISSPQSSDATQQYTTYGNNIKHLRTLCSQIQHPLQLSINNTQILSYKLHNQMRSKVNRLIREKKDKEMLVKLKFAKDQPWEHYYVLDSEWWTKSLKNYRPVSVSDRDLFLWFININVNEDFCAHWKIDCIEAYNRYLNFLARPEDLQVGMDEMQLQNFIELCKSQNVFDVFKRDYLN